MLFQSYFGFIREFLVTKLRFEHKYKLVSIITILLSFFSILSPFIKLKMFFVMINI